MATSEGAKEELLLGRLVKLTREVPSSIAAWEDSQSVLLPEGDAGEWASTLARLTRDGSARRALAERGLHRASAEFAWPIVARRHLDFFDELTDG